LDGLLQTLEERVATVEGELASLKTEHATTSQELVAAQHALEVLQDQHKEVTGEIRDERHA
jgi:predicted  nucleic acid-binding Zn-ribbon protein